MKKTGGVVGAVKKIAEPLAAELGSDVPFCLFGGTALCTGRGERLLRLSGAPSLSLVICKGSESVSTPAAYRALDLLYRDFKHPELLPAQSAEPMAQLCRAGDAEAVAASLYNVFEDAVYPVCPEAMEQRSRLLALGARGALLSGSGSAVFGIFDSPDAADEAASAFGRIAFSVRSAPESIPFAE